MGRRNRLFASVFGLAICLGSVTSPVLAADRAQKTAMELMVADFNSGTKPNNLGGDFGAWIKDPDDPMQGCVESFDRANRFDNSGFALRLVYSVESIKPAFGGFWTRLQNLDASKFDSLALRVRGDSKMGFTTVFRVELKDSLDNISHFYLRGVSDQWQDFVIPLKDFSGITNFRSLKEFVIVFEDTSATSKKGVIYIDDIRLKVAYS